MEVIKGEVIKRYLPSEIYSAGVLHMEILSESCEAGVLKEFF